MRKNVRALVEIAEAALDLPEPVVEFGSYQVEGQEDTIDLRAIFARKQFVGCDMREGPGVDRVEDLESLTFEDGSVGSIIMIDTLEHVQDCVRALNEVHRVLAPNGVVVASSVMDFYIHLHPSDYWRFTPEAFKYLFRDFDQTLVAFQGNPEKPHTVFAVAAKGPADRRAGFAEVERQYRKTNGSLFWRAAQVYYALRDLLANVRGWNNKMGFEIVEKSASGEAPATAAGRDRPA
jgi:SAM-dependent methyltransferase